MKDLLRIIFIVINFQAISLYSFSQSLIEWQKCLGGSNDDFGSTIRQTSDGGFIAAGWTWSDNGDVSGNHQTLGVYSDAWLVKTDSVGNILWQRCRGGSYGDGFYDVHSTQHGGYIATGFTYSNDSDVSGNHGVPGAQSDFWVVKLDTAGNIVWQKCFGGSNDDEARVVQEVQNGGYIVAGNTYSGDGDAISNHGDVDYLVLKLDSAGNIQWRKCLGGILEDKADAIEQTADGGFVIAGHSYSIDGDVTVNHGWSDWWLVKLDSSGSMVWQKSIGGNYDENVSAVHTTTDGGFVFVGNTASSDTGVTGGHGNYDYWVVKTDSAANVAWKKCFGGMNADIAFDMQVAADGGYILCGTTISNDGDVSGNHDTTGFFPDWWIVKLNSTGILQWQQTLGGSTTDEARSVLQSPDGGWVIAGSTDSNDGDVSGNHGNYDFRILKLSALTNIDKNNFSLSSINIFPNPSDGIVHLNFSSHRKGELKFEVVTLLGEIVFETILDSISENEVSLSFLCKGIYVVRISDDKKSISKLLAIQ